MSTNAPSLAEVIEALKGEGARQTNYEARRGKAIPDRLSLSKTEE
jgi:hypothetical protein